MAAAFSTADLERNKLGSSRGGHSTEFCAKILQNWWWGGGRVCKTVADKGAVGRVNNIGLERGNLARSFNRGTERIFLANANLLG